MENTEKSNVVELEYPVVTKSAEGGEITISKITIGRMKAKHLKLLPSDIIKSKGNMDPAKMLPLIAAMAELSEEVIGEIDMNDVIKIVGVMESFLK